MTPYRDAPPPDRTRTDIGTLGDVVEANLRAQGKNPRSAILRESGYRRAEKAVNEIGPDLFPLIAAAEQKVIGTRDLPTGQNARSSRYELHGIIDVVTDVQLTAVASDNVIRKAIQKSSAGLVGNYEVIVDYKGSRRPAENHPYWEQGEWQLQTYAWLRMRQPKSLPVAAGVLIYVNELAPGQSDVQRLKTDINQNRTDVLPDPGQLDGYMLSTWRPGDAIPDFSLDFRLARAIRVIPFDQARQQQALNKFDGVVAEIERCVRQERIAGSILDNWNACGDEETCVACDFRHFCPNPKPNSHVGKAPDAP